MKAKTETKATAAVEEQPKEVKDTTLKPEEPKVGALVAHKERLAGRLQSLRPLIKSKKILAVSGAVALLLVLTFVIPVTRYKVLGLYVKRDLNIAVNDTTTQRVVSGASVMIDGKSFVTNKEGIAELKGIRVGSHAVTITKKYYKDFTSDTVVTLQKGRTVSFRLEATGRQVPVVVKNKIGGAPVSDALLQANDSDTRTDKDGMAVIVVPVGSDEIKAKLTANGYNDAEVTLKVTESAVPENTFALTPSGKVYFLSKQSGKIDVVKTNLDGSDRQIVLAGTGREEEFNTVLLASKDWKYLALLSRRDSNTAKLYLIETGADKLSTIDEGNASFTLNGWAGHSFIYTVNRTQKQIYEAGKFALKGFNAESKQIASLDETSVEGSGPHNSLYQLYDSVTVLEKEVVFNKIWSWNYSSVSDASYYFYNKNSSAVRIDPDGKNRKTIHDFPMLQGSYPSTGWFTVSSRLYAPDELVYRYVVNGKSQYFEYEKGAFKENKELTDELFDRAYPTYLFAPSGKMTLWSESRDGRNVVFVGDDEGKNEKNVANLSELTPYGWYTDDYILVSKKRSELYIMPKAGIKDDKELIKVSDYHRPGQTFYGYGGGYGGL